MHRLVDVFMHAQNRDALSRVGWREFVIVVESNGQLMFLLDCSFLLGQAWRKFGGAITIIPPIPPVSCFLRCCTPIPKYCIEGTSSILCGSHSTVQSGDSSKTHLFWGITGYVMWFSTRDSNTKRRPRNYWSLTCRKLPIRHILPRPNSLFWTRPFLNWVMAGNRFENS